MLLPLVGVPLVEYTLEWLVSSGVTEVRGEHVAGCQRLVHLLLPPTTSCVQIVVFCCAHAEQVQQHLKRAGWLNQRSVSVQARRMWQVSVCASAVSTRGAEYTVY